MEGGSYPIRAEIFTDCTNAPCSCQISQRSANITPDGGEGVLEVSAAPGCSWEVSRTVEWLDVAIGSEGLALGPGPFTGTGNGIVVWSAQPSNGDPRSGGLFIGNAGFLINQLASPTAASVEVSGKVTTASGRPIVRSRISVTMPNGEVKTTLTNPFGLYRFEGLEAGHTYFFSVSAKGYRFAEPVRTVTINDAVENLNFIAHE